MNPSLELARQNCIAFLKVEKYWKKHPPKGKRYKGFRLKPFSEESKNGKHWSISNGWKVIPVWSKK